MTEHKILISTWTGALGMSGGAKLRAIGLSDLPDFGQPWTKQNIHDAMLLIQAGLSGRRSSFAKEDRLLARDALDRLADYLERNHDRK